MAIIKPIPKSRVVKMEQALVNLIWGKAAMLGYKNFELAQILQVNPATVRRRKLYPKMFSAEELLMLCIGLGISPAELAAVIGGSNG